MRSAHVMGQGNRVVALRKDGSSFPVHVELSTIGNDDETLVSASVRDMSAVEDLRSESDRLKEQFLATVSHELRTPLTSILGSAELLAEEVEAIEDPDLRSRLSRFTAMISRGARRQQALVEDLLALTSIDGGDGLGHQCLADLVVVVENSVDEHQPAAAAGGVRLVADTTALPLLVAANETWLSRGS